MEHFTDRYKLNNQHVQYWNFIRGRELAGMIPWFYNLPADRDKFNAAWKHVLDTTQLLGQFGLRTNEPAYEYYFKQFVFTFGKPGSQWNGPSWPYQTSQVLTGMVNLLQNYTRHGVTNSNYLNLLQLYTRQHYLPNGKLNLVENYDPDKGGPIVYFYWSNHYNHSSYNNLVITGLCGLRPDASDTLTLNPLIDDRIEYFCLDDLRYHGHKVTIVYDKNGERYNLGKGLTVSVDGERKNLIEDDDRYKVLVGAPLAGKKSTQGRDHALNINRKGYPQPSASVHNVPDSLFQAIDGKVWYFPEISNRWSTEGSTTSSDWYAVDFGEKREVSTINLSLYTDDKIFGLPDGYIIEYKKGDQWLPLNPAGSSMLTGNTVNTIRFDPVTTTAIRITFRHETRHVALVELECYS